MSRNCDNLQAAPAAPRETSAPAMEAPPNGTPATRWLAISFPATAPAKPVTIHRSATSATTRNPVQRPIPHLMKPTVIRTVVVDDNAIFLDSLIGGLARHPELLIVGRALSGPQAIRLAASLQPDLVISDLQMPEMNGLELCTRLKALKVPPKVILITLHDPAAFRDTAEQAGVDAFLSKSKLHDDLLPAVLQMLPLD